DRTANACVDFYQFANGGWIKSNPIPAAFSRWGSFDELTEQNQQNLTKILDKAAAAVKSGQAKGNTKMLGTYYASCMDSAAAEKAGAAPLKARLTKIDAVTTREGLQTAIAQMQVEGVSAAF